MGYKTYRVHSVFNRTGSDGYQPKFISNDGKKFIKVQCKLGGQLMNDWKVEVIASKLCSHFDFYNIEQKPCHVIVDGRQYMGVESNNLGYIGMSTLSFESILESVGESSNNSWYIKSGTIDKIYSMAKKISSICKISEKSLIEYMVQCAIIDILVYNTDRHTRNYNALKHNEGAIRVAPIHDCGLGLFESDQYFLNYKTWEECNRQCYISPFGEEAFDMLNILDIHFHIRNYLRKFSRPVINKNSFPNEKSIIYFKEICKEVW